MPTVNAMSDYLENKILLDNLTIGTRYVGLFTASPGEANSGTEVVGGGYARQIATFSVVSNEAANNTEIAFPTSTANWGGLTFFGIYDQVTGGNLLFYGALENSQGINFTFTMNTGDSFRFPVDSLSVVIE